MFCCFVLVYFERRHCDPQTNRQTATPKSKSVKIRYPSNFSVIQCRQKPVYIDLDYKKRSTRSIIQRMWEKLNLNKRLSLVVRVKVVLNRSLAWQSKDGCEEENGGGGEWIFGSFSAYWFCWMSHFSSGYNHIHLWLIIVKRFFLRVFKFSFQIARFIDLFE